VFREQGAQVLTTLVAVALAFGPGGLLGFVVPRGRARWAVWAAAPILSLGLTATAMGWLAKLGLPDGVAAVLLVELALVAAALLVSRFWPSGEQPAAGTPVGVLPRRLDLIAVTVPALVCVGLGRSLLGSFRFPPGWDGMNHAYLTRNILSTGSTAISSVCVTGPPPNKVSCTFYPLAADVQWAQAASFAGGHISTSMTAWSVYIGPVALVLAVYAAVRALRGTPLIAAAAATAPAVLGPLWTVELTGRITEGVGPGLSVGVALLAAMALRERTARLRLALLAGLGVTGILLTHTYEVLFAATLALALAVGLRGRFRWKPAWPAAVALVAAMLVSVAPFLSDLLGAKTERAMSPPRFPGRPWASFEYWVTDPQRYVLFGYPAPGTKTNSLTLVTVEIGLWITIPCLLASLLCFRVNGMRWARPWVATWALWTLVGVWTSESSSGPAQALAGLWYGVPERLRTMILPVYGVMAVAGACVIGIGVRRLVERRADGRPAAEPTQPEPGPQSRRPARPLTAAGIGAVVLVTVLVGLAIPRDARVPLHRDLARRSPPTRAYPETFAWLAAHTPKDGIVAADRNVDMMTWLYADYGVKPLFGIPPLTHASLPNYRARWTAWRWLVGKAHPAEGGCLVARLGIDYVVVGPARVPGWARDWTAAGLQASPNLSLVRDQSGVKVFQVTPAGRACSTA
jgi:hypothetical protein